MERLTEHHVDGNGAYIKCSELCNSENCATCEKFGEIVDKLAAYEDTWLEPEKIKAIIDGATKEFSEYDELMPKHRIKALAQAEKDGRLVVLPCKVGDTVWRIIDDCTLPGDCGTKRRCKGCDYRNLFVEKDSFSLSLLGQNGKLNPPYYITREEAEAALKKREDG